MVKLVRKTRLIKPGLQLKLVAMFLAISVLAVLLQSLLMSRSLNKELGDEVAMFGFLRENLLATLAVLVPATVLIGTILTFRIAGPLYRFERFLEEVERGEMPTDCRIRQRDELRELCGLLNRVTRPLRTLEPHERNGGSDVEDAPSLIARSERGAEV